MPVETALLLKASIIWGGFGFFLILELLYPYRPGSVSKIKRLMTNLSLTLFNSVMLNILFGSLIFGMLTYAADSQHGLLYTLGLSAWTRLVVTVLFFDFVLYVWHLLNHKMPTLWRLHRVHHSDLNLDVSTATRFHIGELAISALIRLFLIFSLGVTLPELLVFEVLLVLTAQFQHSVTRVPVWFERLWWLLFVPPSMHRIHHSVIIRERDSNYGTIFSIWDRLLGTLLSKVEQDGIKMGLGAYRDPERLKLGKLLAMPFSPKIK